MDCLSASEEEWRWLQNDANALQKLEIGSSDIIVFVLPLFSANFASALPSSLFEFFIQGRIRRELHNIIFN